MKKPTVNILHFCILLLVICTDLFFAQGKKVETGDIEFNFKKTESFSDAALLDIMLLPREKYFNRINLEEDLGRLNKFYFDNGFFDVAIDTNTVYNIDDDQVDIKFTIIENVQYTVKEFRLQGLDKVSDGVKSSIYSNQLIEAGNPYNRVRINLEKDRIINILQDNGYFFAQIDTVRSRIDSSRRGIIIGKYSEEMQERPEFKDKVLIRMRFIGTQDVYRFGKVDITIDNNKYKIGKFVVERELAFKEGDIFNRSKMVESERNFTKLAIIQLGRVLVDSVVEPGKLINTNVHITLNNKYELTPGITSSYQTNRLYLGANLEYKDKDFFGGGRVLSVTAEGLYNSPDVNILSFGLSLYQPFLFNNNITATLTPKLALINLNEDLQYLVSTNLLRLTYYIADYTFYNNAFSDLTFDYIKAKAKRTYFDTEDSVFVPEGTQEFLVNSIIGLTLVHNNTNNLFNPSTGFYHTLSVESAGALPRLLSLFNKGLQYSQYVKLGSVNSFYFDISGERQASIVATHFEIGDIIEYGSGENIQPVDPLYKYYMGGGNSLRGWGGQKGGILDNPSQGGKFLLEGSLEWRRKPFPQRSILYPVWGVLFLDYGNVWETGKLFKLNQIALAAGFGIRYDTFVGPIRIDLGFKLYDPMAEDGNKWLWDEPSRIFKDKKYAIQFGLGNAF
ncbi:MAG: BamA/TamA family outer membrane protein [Ignavibacteria bacterium]|nr:BamA/TamA family outer membrane protein [Ignavibacteria bacterium]